MSKEADKFIDKYIVGKDDWLLKHKEVISKLLDEYEREQLTLTDVSKQRKLLIAFLEMNNWLSLEDEENAKGVVDCYLKAINCG